MQKMRKKDEFDIQLISLKAGIHIFDYTLLPSFFEQFDYPGWESSWVSVQTRMEKHETFFDIQLSGKGWVEVPCDRTGKRFRKEIHPKAELLVKYGDESNQLNDKVWVISDREHTLNLSKFIFEVVVLSLPEKRIHPNITDQYDEGIEFWTDQKSNQPKTIDPRWEELNKLLKTTKE